MYVVKQGVGNGRVCVQRENVWSGRRI